MKRHGGLQAPVGGGVLRVVGRAAVHRCLNAHPVGAHPASAWLAVAALLLGQLRSPGGSCVAVLKAAIWWAMPRGPSASLKWVMYEDFITCGSAFQPRLERQ